MPRTATPSYGAERARLAPGFARRRFHLIARAFASA